MDDWFDLTDTQLAYLAGRGDAVALGGVSTHSYTEYEGELDLGRFELAWRRLVDRHPGLRTVIDAERGRARVLDPAPRFQLAVHDLRALSPEERQAALAEVRDRLSHEVRPADAWPPLAVEVSLLPQGRARVHLGVDGLTLDLGSVAVLQRELTALYDAAGQDGAGRGDGDRDGAGLDEAAGIGAPPGLTFAEYRRLLAQQEASEQGQARRAAALDYWRGRAGTLPPPPALPLLADPAAVHAPRFRGWAGELPAPLWKAARRAATRRRITPSGLVLAVFAEVVGSFSEHRRFTLNVPRAARAPIHPDVERLVGPLSTFTLLEVDLTAAATFGERALALQRRLWQDLSHPEASGIDVLRILREQGRIGRGPAMPVVFTSTVGMRPPPGLLLGERLPEVFGISQTPQVHLDLGVDEDAAGGLRLRIDAVEQLHDPAVVETMLACFTTALTEIAQDADGAVWERGELVSRPSPVPGSPPGRTPVEQAVALVWRDELGVAEVSVGDDFHRLGGDDDAAHRMLATLREIFEHPTLTVRTLLAAPTLAAFARRLTETHPDPERARGLAEVFVMVSGMSEDEAAAELERWQ